MLQEIQSNHTHQESTNRSSHHGVLTSLAMATPLLVPAVPATAADATQEEQRITAAIDVLQGLTAAPDDAIPEYILDRAEAIVVIPSLVKGGFIVGAEHGTGVMSVRDQETKQWSPPGFVKMTGGTFGWQIGVEAIDLVLVVMNAEGLQDLFTSEFTLGANASVAAGPVGRSADASTDVLMGAKILAYSRAKGLFAGATIEATSLRSDEDANRRLYGRDVSTEALTTAKLSISVPAVAEQWSAALERMIDPAT